MISASMNECDVCGGGPVWTVLRRTDVAKTWACTKHLSEVCARMQQDCEITQLVVTDYVKLHEWAEITQVLRSVEDDFASPSS